MERTPLREGSGAALGIAAMLVFGFTLLPALAVVVLYLFFTIYGFTKGTDLHAETLNLPLLFTGICVVVAALVLGAFAGVVAIGRSFTPRKDREGRGEI